MRHQHSQDKILFALRELVSRYTIDLENGIIQSNIRKKPITSYDKFGYKTISLKISKDKSAHFYQHRMLYLLNKIGTENIDSATEQDCTLLYIDHINGITDDNRICNLREVTRRDNAHNLKCHREKDIKIGIKYTKGKGGSYTYYRTHYNGIEYNFLLSSIDEYDKVKADFDLLCNDKYTDIDRHLHCRNHRKIDGKSNSELCLEKRREGLWYYTPCFRGVRYRMRILNLDDFPAVRTEFQKLCVPCVDESIRKEFENRYRSRTK